MESIWSLDTVLPQYDQLNKNINADVAIIGGGMAGLLIAFLLKEKGIDSVIIEANRICSGVTGNTTAKITAQHNLIYNKIINDYGLSAADKYAKANTQAIDKYEEVINKNNIECDFVRLPAYVYSLGDITPILDEVKAAKMVGINAQFVDKTSLPIKVAGAVKFENQAQFNPLKFISGIIGNLKIYENTPVMKVRGNKIITPYGTIHTKKIILATHYPIVNIRGLYFLRMYQQRSYVIALKGACQLDGMYIDNSPNGYSWRNYKDCLLFGGAGHRSGENQLGGRYQQLANKAKSIFPDCEEVTRWSAQDCVTLDGIPYIGRLTSKTNNLYVATGFNKWGMTASMVSAMIISDMICGIKNSNANIFSPSRFKWKPIRSGVKKSVGYAVKGLSKQVFSGAQKEFKSIKQGKGGVVRYKGKKMGVYRDEDDKIYGVPTRCTHMGCHLEWNQDEKSWDCPCHGSRFDYKGNLLNPPAKKKLRRII